MAAAPAPLPLREDLRLYESAADEDGSPSWVIQDPVTNRFYKIGWFEYECLLRWPADPQRVANDIAASTAIHASPDDVLRFADFLEQNRLVRPSPEGLQRLKQQADAPGWRHWKWWLHHYLFVRVPLVRPDRWLSRLLPWVSPLFTRTALWLIIAASLLGLVLVMRQWDVFTHSVLDLITPAGIAGFVLALLISKTLHELGHALVATRQGLRVAHMGIAFVVLWPMLYTDTGESWRLQSHRQRLAISVAGISTELALAGLATLAWALLDDGVLRQAMLYLATTAWILSLALNVSPFMRFDGYFILSDLLGFPNLHERAGEVARTALRRTVLGVSDTYPGDYSPAVRRNLALFAFVTWAYRFLVFLGIAWAVYALFFKLLGIFLMVVEILWFVLRPIGRELKVWHERWPEVAKRRKFGLWLIVAIVLLALALPWRSSVRAPGVAHPARQQVVFAPEAAQITYLHAPGKVATGQVLVSLEIPEFQNRRHRIQAAIQALENRLSGLMADESGHARRGALLRQLGEQQAELAAIEQQEALLHVSASFSGEWLDIDPMLAVGIWVNTRNALGILMDSEKWVVDAYIGQRDVNRLQLGSGARFYYDGGPGNGLAATIEFIDPARSQRLFHPMLDGHHGGPIPTQDSREHDGVPVDALYRIRLRLASAPASGYEVRGRAVIDGDRRSLLWEGVQWALSVLIRESGF